MFHVFRKQTYLGTPTLQFIEKIFASKWFSSIGRPVRTEINVYVVKSWSEAFEYAKDPDQVFLYVRGDYTVSLQKRAPKRDRQWNDLVILIKKIIEPAIESKLKELDSISEDHKIVLRDAARWTILNACLEVEFSDVMPIGFFLPFAHWYSEGRFPCGWKGDYPDGMAAIY